MYPANSNYTNQDVRTARGRSRRGDLDVATGCMSPRERVRAGMDGSRATRVHRVIRSECSVAGSPIVRAL